MEFTHFWNSSLGITVKWIILVPTCVGAYVLGSIISGILVYAQFLLFGGGKIDVLEFAGAADFSGVDGYFSGIYYLAFLRFPPCALFFITPLFLFGRNKAPFIFLAVLYGAFVGFVLYISAIRFDLLYPRIEILVRSIAELIIPILVGIYVWNDSYK